MKQIVLDVLDEQKVGLFLEFIKDLGYVQPRYNAETESAIQEARDIMSGKIESKGYSSVAEMNADLDAMTDEELGLC